MILAQGVLCEKKATDKRSEPKMKAADSFQHSIPKTNSVVTNPFKIKLYRVCGKTTTTNTLCVKLREKNLFFHLVMTTLTSSSFASRSCCF